MAINIITTPYALNASRRPIVFLVSSDRYASTIFTTITVDENSGFCRYTLGVSHGILAGDVVTPTLFSSYYNVRQTVTSVTATEITTDLVWSNESDKSGTVTRTNNNFQVKCEVIISAVTVGTLYSQYYTSGFWFDVSQILDSQLTLDLPDFSTGIKTTKSNSIKEFTCKFTEVYDTASGISQLKDYATSSAYKVVKASRKHTEDQRLTTDYECVSANDLFLTSCPRASITKIYPVTGGGFHLRFWTSLNDTVQLAYLGYTNGVAGTVAYTSLVSLVNGYGEVYVSPTYFAAFTDMEVWIEMNKTGQITEKLKFNIDRSTLSLNYTIIKWRNRFGAWDSYVFPFDFSLTQETEQAMVNAPLAYNFAIYDRGKKTYFTNPVQVITATSRYVPKEVCEWLFDLQSSKEVYWYNGTSMVPLVNHVVEIPNEYRNDNMNIISFQAELPQIE